MNYENLTSLPIEQKIGQLFFIGIPGPEYDEAAAELIEKINPGGVCLFSRNIKTAEQTRTLLDSIRKNSVIEPFLSLDQEGGLVDRLRRVMTPMPAPNKFEQVSDVRQFARIIAETIRILGFNMDFAPVVDVIDEDRERFSNGLQSRAFGRSASDVTELAGAFLDKLQENGVIGCIKHFPGLGASEVDSHEELPLVHIDKEIFESVDLVPYQEIFKERLSNAVMVAHAAFPKLDLQETDGNGKLLPSSLSFEVVTGLLRQDLGFEGIAITDDLEMGAILKNYGIGEACKKAVLAGEDMLAICADPKSISDGYATITEAILSGEITESRIDESLGRIAKLKSRLTPPLEFEVSRINSLSSEIAELINRLN
ncbi:MAG: glycoside hydrolase family 3 N-terminal domain-containing protein [Blastocatellia bacterium]